MKAVSALDKSSDSWAASSSNVAPREKISVFIITFNEEEQIEECLKSVSFCDEVLVVDSFSTDRTAELAEKHGARVVQRMWPGFREQKQFGLLECKNEWVLNLDADERVTPELQQSILSALVQMHEARSSNGEAELPAGYSFCRVTYHLGRWWRRGGWHPEYRVRLFKKSATKWGGSVVHEKPIIDGQIRKLEGELLHYSYKDLQDQLDRLQKYSTYAAIELYKQGERVGLFSLIFKPVFRSFKFFILKHGYREGVRGLVVALIEGQYTFLKYAKLWALNLDSSSSEEAATTGEKATTGKNHGKL